MFSNDLRPFLCICDSFFTGPACDQPVAGCPNMCSGMGHCEYGRCKCAQGRAGADCSLAEDFTCPGWPACGGSKRGVCIDRECSCHAGYHGKACEHDSRQALIAGCPAHCTGHGACTPRPRAHPAVARAPAARVVVLTRRVAGAQAIARQARARAPRGTPAPRVTCSRATRTTGTRGQRCCCSACSWVFFSSAR